MRLPNPEDTICAIATPPGAGAIAVIRISGNQTYQVMGSFFRGISKGFDLNQAAPGTIHHGYLEENDQTIDEVLITLFKKPHSYTGEDVVEISCHGSTFIQNQILTSLLERGCRMADPGEFTLRGFLNGKFDLAQAEAVADLISAHADAAHDQAIHQLRGGFSERIRELRSRLVHFSSLIELELDFGEEEVEFASRTDLSSLLDEMEKEISHLIASFSLGNVIKKGIPVAIIGKPNVGKSTLLNTLLNEEKAIVSEIPGTTRDAIEDTIVLDGYAFRFIDTAGLRASEDQVEMMGIGRTWSKMEEASIILYIFDATRDTYKDVAADLKEIDPVLASGEKRCILIGNKTDLLTELPRGFQDFVDHETLFVSAKRKENIQLIASSLVQAVKETHISLDTIVTNLRHQEALKKVLEALQAIRHGMEQQIPMDLLTVDIRQALQYLGEITGEITTDEILGSIFSRFCIGK